MTRPKREPRPVVCVVCGSTFYSIREGATYNAPKFCSNRCFSIDWKRNNPEKVKESRKRTHLKHREKDLENNRRWWLKNRKKLKSKRAEYQKSVPIEKHREYSRRHYEKNWAKERDRAFRAYYLGHKNPKGDLGWLRKARTSLRNAQRLLLSGQTPEACVSQKRELKAEKTLQT